MFTVAMLLFCCEVLPNTLHPLWLVSACYNTWMTECELLYARLMIKWLGCCSVRLLFSPHSYKLCKLFSGDSGLISVVTLSHWNYESCFNCLWSTLAGFPLQSLSVVCLNLTQLLSQHMQQVRQCLTLTRPAQILTTCWFIQLSSTALSIVHLEELTLNYHSLN